MHSMTLEQLRATAHSGGLAGVTLKGQGGGFVVEISTRSGHDAVLTKVRSTEPRRFGNPSSALMALRDVGGHRRGHGGHNRVEPRPKGCFSQPSKRGVNSDKNGEAT